MSKRPKPLLKSPLRYPGGKSRSIKTLLKYLPANFKDAQEYREPFVGGGSFFITLKQIYPDLKIWINDLNSELFLFWKYTQLDLPNLIKNIRAIKQTHQDGKKLFEKLSTVHLETLSELERAVRFFILNRITFSGTIESGGFSQESFLKRFTDSSVDRLERLAPIMQGIKITNLDYSEVIKQEGDQTFIFLDPPYLKATHSRLYGKDGYLHLSFEHQRFAKIIQACSCQWLITYDNSAQIRENFKQFNCHDLEVQYGMNNYKKTSAAKGKELIITNYERFSHDQQLENKATLNSSYHQLSLNL